MHALATPPAFVLSQDQTLQFSPIPNATHKNSTTHAPHPTDPRPCNIAAPPQSRRERKHIPPRPYTRRSDSIPRGYTLARHRENVSPRRTRQPPQPGARVKRNAHATPPAGPTAEYAAHFAKPKARPQTHHAAKTTPHAQKPTPGPHTLTTTSPAHLSKSNPQRPARLNPTATREAPQDTDTSTPVKTLRYGSCGLDSPSHCTT